MGLLADRIHSHAQISARPGQLDDLEAIAAEVRQLEDVRQRAMLVADRGDYDAVVGTWILHGDIE